MGRVRFEESLISKKRYDRGASSLLVGSHFYVHRLDSSKVSTLDFNKPYKAMDDVEQSSPHLHVNLLRWNLRTRTWLIILASVSRFCDWHASTCCRLPGLTVHSSPMGLIQTGTLSVNMPPQNFLDQRSHCMRRLQRKKEARKNEASYEVSEELVF